jgi:hypothetical protein
MFEVQVDAVTCSHIEPAKSATNLLPQLKGRGDR